MVKAQEVQDDLARFKAEVNELLHGPDLFPEQGLVQRVVALETERHVTAGKFQEWLKQFSEEEKTPERLRQILRILKLAGCNVTVEDDLAEEVQRLRENAADAEQDYETARVLAGDHREEHRNALTQANQMLEEARERLNASDAQNFLDFINEVDLAEEPASPD